MKQNNWDKIPFENIINTIVDKQGRDNYDPHKISRKENKNFFSIHWFDDNNEVVVLTKSGRKMLRRAIQPFLAEKIKSVDIDHNEHGNIDAIKISTKNRIYTYSPYGKDGETISINRWFELYCRAKRYNFKLFLKRNEIENLKLNEQKTIIVDKEEFRFFLETENLTLGELEEKPIFTNEELSLDSFKLKYINYIPEDKDCVFAFQDTLFPKDDWDEDSFLYLHLNSKGKIMKCPQGENSLLIKLS